MHVSIYLKILSFCNKPRGMKNAPNCVSEMCFRRNIFTAKTLSVAQYFKMIKTYLSLYTWENKIRTKIKKKKKKDSKGLVTHVCHTLKRVNRGKKKKRKKKRKKKDITLRVLRPFPWTQCGHMLIRCTCMPEIKLVANDACDWPNALIRTNFMRRSRTVETNFFHQTTYIFEQREGIR